LGKVTVNNNTTTESINRIIYIIYLSRRVTQKLVLGSFDNINFKRFFFAQRRYNDKLSFSNYLTLDILHSTYNFGDTIFFTGVGL